MQWIVQIEEPLHALPFTALSVVVCHKRPDNNNPKLNKSIHFIDAEKPDDGVHKHTTHHCYNLPFKISVKSVDVGNGKNSDAAPVGRKGNCTDSKGNYDFQK